MAKPRTKAWLLALLVGLTPLVASAIEYRSVAAAKAVLYDAPSAQGKKLYVVSQGYPVEIIVNLGDWLKIRDNNGSLSWIEAKQLGTKRTVLVVQPQVEMRQAADAASGLVAHLEKDVVVDLIEAPGNGWVKVKHRDGLVGYIPTAAVWGL
ncbi:MAG TPA: SH3 domain-containing protein [Methylophilaceae bacterium]|nr:SH3 domain-containing protein [Methylophilaceae bacterium]